MPLATINRPDCGHSNFTKLPNDLFNFGHLYPELKPRDVTVLLYLLSKPKSWNINRQAIANALNIGLWSVNQAFKKLQQLGFATYQRTKKGFTSWIISIPEKLTPTRATKPHDEKPPVGNPYVGNQPALETNDSLEINKETTNVASEIDLKIPNTLSDADKKAVKIQLAKLPNTELQLNVLIVLTAALTKNTVKNAVGYTHTLVKQALNGSLSTPKPTDKPLTPLEKEKLAKQKLFDFFNRNLVVLKREFLELKKDYVWVKGLGNITRDTFREFLAVTEGATC